MHSNPKISYEPDCRTSHSSADRIVDNPYTHQHTALHISIVYVFFMLLMALRVSAAAPQIPNITRTDTYRTKRPLVTSTHISFLAYIILCRIYNIASIQVALYISLYLRSCAKQNRRIICDPGYALQKGNISARPEKTTSNVKWNAMICVLIWLTCLGHCEKYKNIHVVNVDWMMTKCIPS